MPFWTNPSNLLPKRAYRWVISFKDTDAQNAANRDLKFFAKSVEKPTYDIGVQEAKFLYSHTFKFPKRITWKPINIVFYDVALTDSEINVYKQPYEIKYKNYPQKVLDFDGFQSKQLVEIKKENIPTLKNKYSTQKFFYQFLKNSGYNTTNDSSGSLMQKYTFKDSLINNFGKNSEIKIQELSENEGENNILETWKIKNPMITNVSFDKLDYSSEEILKITVTLNYDWAELDTKDSNYKLKANVVAENEILSTPAAITPNVPEQITKQITPTTNTTSQTSGAPKVIKPSTPSKIATINDNPVTSQPGTATISSGGTTTTINPPKNSRK